MPWILSSVTFISPLFLWRSGSVLIFFFFTQSDFVCVGLNLVHILVGLLVSSYYFFSL